MSKNDIRIVTIMKRKARKASTTYGTGTFDFGSVATGILTLAYYPVCRRFAWFLNGEATTKKEAIQWLISATT